MNSISVFTDGGSRGNPGKAAIGVFIENEKKEVLVKIGKRIGVDTNNVAEYKAVTEAFNWLLANKNLFNQNTKIKFHMDSQLVFSQLSGLFKVKNENIRSLIFTIRQQQQSLGLEVVWVHIPREKNHEADQLVNLALDNLL